MIGQSGRTDINSWLVNAATKNPEGLLLLAAGAALLLRSGSSITRRDHAGYSSSEAAAGSRARQAANSAQQYVSDAVARTSETAAEMAETAGKFVDDTKQTISEQSARLADNARSTVHDARSNLQSAVERIVSEQPLVVAMAGLAAGAGVAALFPQTNLEREAFEPVVSKTVREATSQVKDAAGRAGEALKAAADERGINTDGLKKVVTEIADAAVGKSASTPKPNGTSDFQSNYEKR